MRALMYCLVKAIQAVLHALHHGMHLGDLTRGEYIDLIIQLGALFSVRALPGIADQHNNGDKHRLNGQIVTSIKHGGSWNTLTYAMIPKFKATHTANQRKWPTTKCGLAISLVTLSARI
jgi:hypothetical protein